MDVNFVTWYNIVNFVTAVVHLYDIDYRVNIPGSASRARTLSKYNMSVISTQPELLEETRLPCIHKCAFVGPRWSGKTYRLQKERSILLASGFRVHVMDLNDILSNAVFDHVDAFKTEGDMNVVARAVQQKHVDASIWKQKIQEYIQSIPHDSMILCDGVLYKSELQALRELGFYIVYVDAVMKTRLQRLQASLKRQSSMNKRARDVSFEDVLRWVTHPTEKNMRTLMDYADLVIDSSEQVDFNKPCLF